MSGYKIDVIKGQYLFEALYIQNFPASAFRLPNSNENPEFSAAERLERQGFPTVLPSVKQADNLAGSYKNDLGGAR